MIRNLEEKIHAENRIRKLENIISSFKRELLPGREEQFKIMSKVYVEKIIELREEIETYTGMDLITIERKDINIHIKGPIIDYGSAPISVVSAYLDNFRKTLQRVYGIVNDIDIKTKVPEYISKMTDLSLVAYAPGSINLSLSLPEEQVSFFEEKDNNKTIDNSLELYFDILKWLSGNSQKSKKIEELQEEKLEKLLINILKTLPDNKNITSIEFFGDKISDKIRVNQYSKAKLIDMIKKIEREEELLEYRGRIRELDLDNLTFSLRNLANKEERQLKCQLNEEIIADIKNYFDNEVIITGVKKGKYLLVKYMEKI